ncbi:hypothetical protein Bca52824_055275 [Brassica carinata]|uniref:Uncharacterized protein n=1 Tax=Brassica carinata TaxID=52824 RepID=A0A8X7ULA4_BRACI|nr:hypothetical protein Bca52824_055275 [Brassica carinata]
MSRGSTTAPKGKKKGGVAFTIDCSKPVDDKIMDIALLENKITVTSDSQFSKRVIAANKDRNLYGLRYFNIAENEAEEED